MSGTAAVQVTGLISRFGPQVVHDGVEMAVEQGEVMGIVGGSGTGKSVLLRTMFGLRRPQGGKVEVMGIDPHGRGAARQALLRRIGVLFQDGALFSSLTVAQNIEAPMLAQGKRGRARLSARLRGELAAVKIGMVGLPADAAHKYPSQLSGGMRKRAGLARALALDPAVVFLDEPTAGLDPIGATEFDALIGRLQKSLGLTVVMVTHDLDSLFAICDRVAVLVDRGVKVGTLQSLMDDPHPWIQDYFNGVRGRAAASAKKPGPK